MSPIGIKIFQVDDWAFVAAKSSADAANFIETLTGRPDDLEDQDIDEVTPTDNLLISVQEHTKADEGFPALIAIDGHYS